MPRFFVPAGQVDGARATVRGPDAAHLSRSLRARPGERIQLVDDRGREHGVRLLEVGDVEVTGEVEWSRPATGEPGLAVHVLQALPKEGMEEAIASAVAAGAASIRPCLTERSVPRPDSGRVARRVERWAAVAREAAQVAGRGTVPAVHPPAPLARVLGELPTGTRILACVMAPGARPLSRLRPPTDGSAVALCIGPEGGLGPADLAALDSAGASSVHLGPRTLRSRHAGGIATALLLASAGELDELPAGPGQLPGRPAGLDEPPERPAWLDGLPGGHSGPAGS